MEGFAATSELVAAVESHLGHSISSSSGLVRIAFDDGMGEALRDAVGAQKADLPAPMQQRWLTRSEASALAGGEVGGLGAAFAPGARSIDPVEYLKGLWSLCEHIAPTGVACWRQERIDELSQLSGGNYDAVVVCAGAGTGDIKELAEVPLRRCRGQNLLLRNPVSWKHACLEGGGCTFPMPLSESESTTCTSIPPNKASTFTLRDGLHGH